MRKFRFVLLLLAAVVIVGLFPGSYFRSKTQTASSGGGGGNSSASSTDETRKVYCVVEQGVYIGLTVEVWENGERLTPVDELDGDDPDVGNEYATGFDVYEVTPGESEIRIVNAPANNTKSGEVRAGSFWGVTFYDNQFSYSHYTSAATIPIPNSVTVVQVYFSHL